MHPVYIHAHTTQQRYIHEEHYSYTHLEFLVGFLVVRARVGLGLGATLE
jgi:hypothetical protein